MGSTWGIRPTTARRCVALLATALIVPALAGCSLLESPTSEVELSGLAACALGHTWTTDLNDAAEKISTELTNDKIPVTSVTAEGTQTLEWSVEGHAVLTPSYTITITTAPAADQVITIVETHSGKASGAIYINGEVGIPRKWDGTGAHIDTVADNNGAALEELPFPIPKTSFDDSVGLELTCEADTLSIHPRGAAITQLWSRAS